MTLRPLAAQLLAALLLGGVALPALAQPTTVPAADSTAALQPMAAVEALTILQRQPAFGGMTFNERGPYELIKGIATVALDPRHPRNRAIVDIDLVRDPDGKVRYQTDVVLLRPFDAQKSSGVLLVDIPNRGNKLGLVRLNGGANQMDTPEQAGNAWLMRHGHSMLWVGWQGDVPLDASGQVVGTKFPVAHGVLGTSLEEVIFDDADAAGKIKLSYPASNLDQRQARLTVQGRPGDLPRTIPVSEWHYVNDAEIAFTRPADEDAGAIYQFRYEARDPMVMGLGMAALRDITQLMKQPRAQDGQPISWLADAPPQTVVVMGISQSGRFLRDMLWQGFGEDAAGRPVFDGAMPIIAGSRKSYTNARWAQPGRYSRQHEDHFFYGDQFPFSYATTLDPVSGKHDGIFAACDQSQTCPKLMHVDSSLEFWQARSSLLVTDADGKAIAVPDNVRLYLMGSTQHGPAAKPAYGICQTLSNPAQQAPTVRALMSRLIAWSHDNVAPPASRFPVLADGTLVTLDQLANSFPDLAGQNVRFPSTTNVLSQVDHSSVPPVADATRYTVLLPTVDQDGHDIAAISAPDIAVPVATYTGWSLRAPGYAEGELCSINGSMIPFASTPEEREATHDPRPSLTERYTSREDYVAKVTQAANDLAQAGYLLTEDVPRWAAYGRHQAEQLPLDQPSATPQPPPAPQARP